ncbi:glycoside hydrolase superfamily [Suillus cothurnatus]|nr:glycoside hydrolase superfamily [Suillus cothurnatus]
MEGPGATCESRIDSLFLDKSTPLECYHLETYHATFLLHPQHGRIDVPTSALSPMFLILAFTSYKAFFSESIQHPSSPQLDSSTKALQTQTSSSIPPALSDTPEMQGRGKYSVGYFVNWGIYGRKFQPSSIPAQDLTHILYAFADLRPDLGEVVLSDAWADKDIHYLGDSWNDVGNNLYGNFKAIYKLKQQNRHLKVLLSIGGWTYSPKFHPIVVNPALRANFVRSAVRLLEDYGLDGLNVDYEYPSHEHQARGYIDLLRELRAGLDHHAQMKGIYHRFLLTIAAPCGPDNYQKLHVREMDQYLDFWNMMAYNFSGSWDSVANHQANIYGGPISTSQAITWYTANSVPRSKMVLGIPLYGRSFMNTSGPGAPFSGINAKESQMMDCQYDQANAAMSIPLAVSCYRPPYYNLSEAAVIQMGPRVLFCLLLEHHPDAASRSILM